MGGPVVVIVGMAVVVKGAGSLTAVEGVTGLGKVCVTTVAGGALVVDVGTGDGLVVGVWPAAAAIAVGSVVVVVGAGVAAGSALRYQMTPERTMAATAATGSAKGKTCLVLPVVVGIPACPFLSATDSTEVGFSSGFATG